MYILGLCDNASVLEALGLIKTIINIVRIAVPVILIVSLSLDFVGAIKVGDDDLLKKATSSGIKKIIAALIIFLVPTFVNIIVNVSNPDNDFSKCLGLSNNVSSVYSTQIESLIASARNNNDIASYSKALELLGKIEDENKRNSYKSELDSIYRSIVSNTSNKYTRSTYPYSATAGSGSSGSGSGSSSNPGNVSGKYLSPTEKAWSKRSQNNTYCTYARTTSSIIHDASVPEGTEIFAPFSGNVRFVQNLCKIGGTSYYWSYGNKVELTGDNGEGAIFGHFSKYYLNGYVVSGITASDCNKVSGGDCSGSQGCRNLGGTYSENVVGSMHVNAGDKIGYSGNTGNSSGPHLHIELKDPVNGGCVVDPWSNYFGW